MKKIDNDEILTGIVAVEFQRMAAAQAFTKMLTTFKTACIDFMTDALHRIPSCFGSITAVEVDDQNDTHSHTEYVFCTFACSDDYVFLESMGEKINKLVTDEMRKHHPEIDMRNQTIKRDDQGNILEKRVSHSH